jgi:PhnB protein
MTSPAPPGYSTVSPYLIVDGADATIDFVRRVFGAEVIRRFEADGGGVLHAEVRIGETVVMIADGNAEWKPIAANVHVYVEDVDATHSVAIRVGAESVQEPERRGDEDRRGGVRDPGGTTWWIATREG